MTRIINGTPHDVNIIDYKGNIIKTYPTIGNPIRLGYKVVVVGSLDGVPVTQYVPTESNLPDPSKGTVYIVSALIKQLYPQRHDLVSPNTTGALKDENGNIIGVKGFLI